MTAPTPPDVTTDVIDLTPEAAQAALDSMIRNRNVRQRSVDAYIRDMLAGEWHFTAEPIKFDKDGHLVDGQHRCIAVVRSGVTIRTLVVRGVEPSAQDYMDSGAARTAGDMLTINGYASGNELAAAARLLMMYDAKDYTLNVTKSALQDYVMTHPALEDAVRGGKTVRGTDLHPRVRYVCWYILSAVDKAACIRFFDSLSNNATEGRDDPRNALLQRLRTAKDRREMLEPEVQISMVLRAWNAWRTGRAMRTIPTSTRSDGGVSMPEPI